MAGCIPDARGMGGGTVEGVGLLATHDGRLGLLRELGGLSCHNKRKAYQTSYIHVSYIFLIHQCNLITNNCGGSPATRRGARRAVGGLWGARRESCQRSNQYIAYCMLM